MTITQAGTLTLGGIRTFNIGTGSTLNWTGQSQSTASGNEGAGIIKSGTGTLNWGPGPGTNVRYDGGFTLNAGTVIVSGTNSFSSGAMTINGGTIQSSLGLTYTSSSLTIGGDFTFSGTGNDVWKNAIGIGSATRTITDSTSGSRAFTGVVTGSGSAGLSFNGSGTGAIYLTNASNAFAGPITITGGEVGFANDGSFGTSTSIVVDGGRLTSAGATGTGVTSTWSPSRSIQVGDTAGTSINVADPAGDLTYNGVISDAAGKTGAWAKAGPGIMRLGGSSTYSGATAINAGTLQVTTANDRLPIGTTVSIGTAGTALALGSANTGTLDLDGVNQQIAGLNSIAYLGTSTVTTQNTVTTSTGSSTLTLGGSGTYSYGGSTAATSGVITGAIALVKTGSGIQTIGGSNTYTGGTIVSGGTLRVNNASGSGTGTLGITIASGGTFGGSGSVSGAVMVNAGAKVTAGADATHAGAFTTGDQAWNSGGSYVWKLNDLPSPGPGTAGTNWDLINMQALIVPSAPTSPFTVSVQSFGGSTPTSGTAIAYFSGGTFEIASLASSNIPGVVAGSGATIILTGPNAASVADSNAFALDTSGFANGSASDGTNGTAYLEFIGSGGGTGGTLDVVYNATPEPGTALLFIVGTGPVLVRRRRRQVDPVS